MINTDAPFYQSEKKISEDWNNVLAAKSDIKNFAALYDKYYIPVYRFVYQRADSVDDAADITSQVFLKAMQTLEKYEFKGLPFASWLFRIAYNEVIQYFRKKKTERNYYLNNEGQWDLMEEFELNDEHSPEKTVRKLLENLNPSEMELVEMRYFEKRSFKEIAEITNQTETNAKVRVHRILKKLKADAEKYNLVNLITYALVISLLIAR